MYGVSLSVGTYTAVHGQTGSTDLALTGGAPFPPGVICIEVDSFGSSDQGPEQLVEPTSGTVQITRLDATAIEGNIDVTFGSSGHVIAGFSAPVCVPSGG